jgi:nucleoside-diphosphate-sugar epimerase
MLEHINASPMLPKRVVIMGAAGFVGGAIALRLRREGVSVLALTSSDINLLDADADQRLAAMLDPADAFVAASARAPVKNCDMLLENLVMTRAMVRALSIREVAHVVNISSDAIYADSDSPLTESSCASPDSLHGAMHLTRETMFRNEVKAPIAMLRPSLIYGASDPHNGYGPNRFRRLANAGRDIELFGEGEERRDHVYIDDVAELAAQVLLWRSQGSLNIATGEVHSFRSVAEQVIALSAHDVALKKIPRNGPIPHNGFRPFAISTCKAAFPNFSYTLLKEGLEKLHSNE